MMMDAFDPAECTRISAALVKALGEATFLAGAGDIGTVFWDLVKHARELHDLLLEQLLAAEPVDVQYLCGIADAMGNKISELERLKGVTWYPKSLR
jgi:hypothetical protein